MKCVKQVTVMLITCLPMVGPLLVVIFMKKCWKLLPVIIIWAD